MSWSILYTEKARQDLLRIKRATAQRIVLKIKEYSGHTDPLHFAKKLKPPFDDCYRFRIGSYRAIFEVGRHREIRLLIILRVKHRSESYDQTSNDMTTTTL